MAKRYSPPESYWDIFHDLNGRIKWEESAHLPMGYGPLSIAEFTVASATWKIGYQAGLATVEYGRSCFVLGAWAVRSNYDLRLRVKGEPDIKYDIHPDPGLQLRGKRLGFEPNIDVTVFEREVRGDLWLDVPHTTRPAGEETYELVLDVLSLAPTQQER